MLNEIYEIIAVPDISPNYEIGAVVTVVDGKNYLKQQKKYAWFFTNQIKWAHRLVLSKTGLVDKDTIVETISVLRDISDAHDIEAGEWETFTPEDWERIFAGNNDTKAEEHLHCNGCCSMNTHHKTEHQHDGFTGISIPSSRSFSKYSLDSYSQNAFFRNIRRYTQSKGNCCR